MSLKRVQLIKPVAEEEPVNPKPRMLRYRPETTRSTYKGAMALIDRAFALFHDNPDQAPWFLVMATPDGRFKAVALVKEDQGHLLVHNKAFAGITLARR